MRMTFLLAAFMGAVGVALLAIGAAGAEVPTKQVLFEMGIAALSAGFVGVAYDSVVRRDFLHQVKQQLETILYGDALRLGVTDIYETRTKKIQKYDFPKVCEGARSEIMIVGLGLNSIIHAFQRHLVQAIARNVKIKFLIFNLEGLASTLEMLDRSLAPDELVPDLKRSFKRVVDFANEYAQTGKVEAHIFNVIPTFGAVAIDREEDNGFLIVELNCYSSPGEECPSLRLEKKPGGLFHTYDRQITQLWKNSSPVAAFPVSAPQSSQAAPSSRAGG